MYHFEENKIIVTENILNRLWVFRVSDVFNPSQEEIAKNKAFNDTLGDYEPDKELPTRPLIKIIATSEDGETLDLWWDPIGRTLGPHISKQGWSKGLLNNIKGKLCNWQITT